MYIALLTYQVPIEEVDTYLDAHKVFLEKNYEQRLFIFSGRRNPRTGGVILVNVKSEEEVNAIIQQDPFYQHGIATYEVIDFTPTMYDDRFLPFIQE